jgi:hypothetical protein
LTATLANTGRGLKLALSEGEKDYPECKVMKSRFVAVACVLVPGFPWFILVSGF